MDDELDQAIDEALDGKPRAAEIAAMVAALVDRRDAFVRERDGASTPDDQKAWADKVHEVEKQIRLLREEQAITEFVENSVRFTASKPRLDEED